MTNRTKRTFQKEAELLALIAAGEYLGAAAEKCGIGRQTVYDWKNENAEFAAALEKAQRDGDDVQIERMEREADRRAIEGTDKGVYYEGARVAVERQYSDTLLMFRLKAKKPEAYRERHEFSVDPKSPLVPTVNITVSNAGPGAPPQAANGTPKPSN